MTELTPRQERILRAVEWCNHGAQWPTLDDIADEAGVLRHIVHVELYRMRDAGIVEYAKLDGGRYCITDLRRVI